MAMSDVFISYKRENLAAVGRLVEALRAEGVGVWWDQDISLNVAWEAAIEQALAAAKLVIVAWSPAAVASENVKAEARWAQAQGRLLQVFVEACEAPLFFGERQGLDLKNWSGGARDPAFRALLQAVRAGPTTPPAEDALAMSPCSERALTLPTRPSIAVMPFANLSGDPEQEYFADGMVVEITNALSRFKSLFVIASGSTLSFKGKGVGPQDVASQLGVRYVLEGSVRKAANRVRISVQLIDAADGTQVWTQRFEDTLDDVFDLQDRVALAVAGVIEPTVLTAELQRLSKRPTENMGSYDLYLRALALSPFTRAGNVEALELLNRAIALDGGFGSALSAASFAHMMIVIWGWSDEPELHRRQAIELANRALNAAGDDATVLYTVANVVGFLERDQRSALDLVERAISLNPGESGAWRISGILRLRLGETDLAVEHLETALRLNPTGRTRPAQVGWLGQARFQQGRFGEAAPLLQELVQQTENPRGFAFLAACYGHLGQPGLAMQALRHYRAISNQSIEANARALMDDPKHIQLFLDGIALAEGLTDAPPATHSGHRLTR